MALLNGVKLLKPFYTAVIYKATNGLEYSLDFTEDILSQESI